MEIQYPDNATGHYSRPTLRDVFPEPVPEPVPEEVVTGSGPKPRKRNTPKDGA